MTPSTADPQYSEILVSKRSSVLKGQRRARLEHALAAADLPARPNARVLDLGCADGILWPDLRGRVGSIIGVNYDEWLSRQCRQRFPDGIVMRADARKLPFADASFDLIICLEMFHFLDLVDHEQGIGEMRRVLRPGGRLVLTVPIEVGVPGLIKFAIRVATKGCWPDVATHAHMLWRRMLYPLVDMREADRRTPFHVDAYKLGRQVRSVFGAARCTRMPYVYPFVTTAMIVADR